MAVTGRDTGMKHVAVANISILYRDATFPSFKGLHYSKVTSFLILNLPSCSDTCLY